MFALTMFTFNSCKKDDDTAYQPKGTYGNSNISSEIWTVSTWGNNGGLYYSDFNISTLTASVQNAGAVEVFLSTDGGATWKGLPFTQYGSTSNYLWSFQTQTGLVTVKWTYDGSGLGSDPNTVYGAICKFKIVCISAAGLKTNPNVDYRNYEVLKNAFNLKD